MFFLKKNKKRKKKLKIFSFPRMFAYSFAIIAMVQAFSLGLSLKAPEMVLAAENKPITYKMQVPIPGIKNPIEFGNSTAAIANYVKGIYNYAVGIVGILAAIMLMIGGFRWIMAGGNTSSIGEAKEIIFAAISGLILVMTSYLILSQINPALTEFKITPIMNPNIKAGEAEIENNLGACNWVKAEKQTTAASGFEIATEELCNSLGSVASDEKNCTAEKNASDGSVSYKCCCNYNKNSSSNCSWDKSGNLLATCEGEEQAFTGDEGIKKCGSSGYPSFGTCCCKQFSFSNFPCQGNICQQKKHADDSLIKTLDCLGGKLLGTNAKISSISDNHLLTEFWEFCSVLYPKQCKNNNSDSEKCCYHSFNSCHYGGGIEGKNKSMAVDLVGDKTTIEQIANKYKSECGIGFILNEGDHIHISTTACSRQ